MAWNLGAGLEGRGVILTGATGGIGTAAAHAFAAAGARVMAVDLDQDRLDGLVGSLVGDGHVGMAADLGDVAAHDNIVASAKAALGDVHVLANLAAVIRRGTVEEVTEDDWDFQHNVNLRAAFFLSRSVANLMIQEGSGGRIILFSSQSWWTGGYSGGLAYAASKGGITTLCRGLARTYGPHQITVNCISPGLVQTSMLMDGLAIETYESLKRQTPLGRIGRPDELAGPIVFLASDHARFITGATLNVSGGFLMY